MKKIWIVILMFGLLMGCSAKYEEEVIDPHFEEVQLAHKASRDVFDRCISAGDVHTVALRKDGTVVATGNNKFGQCNVEDWDDIRMVLAGGIHTVALRKDGTVVAVGDNEDGQCNVEDWTDIVEVIAGYDYTIGIKEDGTVIATGDKRGYCSEGRNEVERWNNIVAIDDGNGSAFGLTNEGKILAVDSTTYDEVKYLE